MNQNNSTLGFIVISQIVGCVLVIMGHSYPLVQSFPRWLLDSRTFLYCFHMPLFVWCSGFLLCYTSATERHSFGEYVKRRAFRLLVPYLLFSLVGLIPKIIFSRFLNDRLELDILSILRAFLVPRENIWGHFWFLPMIFSLGVIGYLMKKFIARLPISYFFKVVGFLGLCLLLREVKYEGDSWLGVRDIFDYLWIFVLGMVSSKIAHPNFSFWRSIMIFWGCLTCSLFIFEETHPTLVSFEAVLIAILMITGIVAISCMVANKIDVNRSAIYARTYQLFILSWPCQLVAEVILERIARFPYYVTMPITFVVGVLVPMGLLVLVDKIEKRTNTRFLSIMLGQ